MEKSKVPQKILIFLTLILLLSVMWVYGAANISHYTAHLEADIAGETVLAEVLYENHHVQPGTWVASTATRIIGPPLLASFIYPLTGGNLNLSMGIACTVMMILMAVVTYYFCRTIGMSVLSGLVSVLLMFVLCAPADETQRMLYLYANYYVGHFIPMFIILQIYAAALKRGGRLTAAEWMIGTILAVINGFQGIHASMFFYLPLLGTEILRRGVLFLRKEKEKRNAVSVWSVVICAIAFALAKIFGAYMSSGASRNIRHAPEKFIGEVLPNFRAVLGYGRLEFLVLILVFIAIAGYCLAVRNFGERPELWSIIPIFAGIVVVLLSSTFTTAEVAPRYFVMQVFAVGIGVGVFIELFSAQKSYWLSLLAVVYGLFSLVAFYEGLVENDYSEDSGYMQVARWMQDNDYEYGYSTFDHANTITVMSNNAVKVRGINSFNEMEGIKWLSDSTWYPPAKSPEGYTCYITTSYTQGDFESWLIENDAQVIETAQVENFKIYVLDHDYTVWVR